MDIFIFSISKWHLPHAIVHGAVAVEPDEPVGFGDVVEVGLLLISKEEVWQPQSVGEPGVKGQHRLVRQVPIIQACIVPHLTHEDGNNVVLDK